jgi:Tol biopolymer transport system component
MKPSLRIVAILICLVLVLVATSRPGAEPKYSEWVAATNLGPVVNSSFFELSPAVSKDGLSLYFTSDRPGGYGNLDIWVSHRATEDDAWGVPANLGPVINSAISDNATALSRDGHWLFFARNPSGFGQIDIWASWREHTDDDFHWGPPFNLGAGVNSVFAEGTPSFLENDEGYAPQLFFFSTRPGIGLADIYVSELQSNGVFGPAAIVPELSGPARDISPSVRFDGLEIFFHSDRPGSVGNDLWVSTRNSAFDAWSAPQNLGSTVNTAFSDQQPHIAADRETLYFASDRPGGIGLIDLYVTTRAKDKHQIAFGRW